MTTWSPQQEQALLRVRRWIREKTSPYFLLAGYAGTGKSTLAAELTANVEGPVLYAAFTGKAASVLAKKGVQNVSTLHKLIYTTRERSKLRLTELEAQRERLLDQKREVPRQLTQDIIRERQSVRRPSFSLKTDSALCKAKLLVVDEYSMIDEPLGLDLLSFGVPILALGDPGQLPPVRGRQFFQRQPDVMLTEIHRQAADNPIIWLSREVREGRHLPCGQYGGSRVISAAAAGREALQESVLAADQLLVGRNETRRNSNARFRQLRGLAGTFPVAGDKLVCLRNNHELGVLNGQLWKCSHDAVYDGNTVALALDGDDGTQIAVRAHSDYFRGREPPPQNMRDADSFDYGYALTVHKSQGSQWPAVTLFDEWDRANRKEWLYTGITRAAERVDVVQM